jgi:triosephosphate isomerase
MARRPFVAGNWKLHKGPSDAVALAAALKGELMDMTAVDVAVAPPFVSIPGVANALRHTGIHVAGQDLHPATSGAFTSAIAGEMLKEAGCTYVIVGHSERRLIFKDDDGFINEKVHAALRCGLLPILCIGETLEERDAGRASEVVRLQLQLGLAGLEPDQVVTTTLAYEPVWAIGTGRTATPAQAQEMHAGIRAWLAEQYPPFVANQVRIQYGGSVKPSNAAELLSQPDIDGALVGGAALQAESFLAIVRAGA